MQLTVQQQGGGQGLQIQHPWQKHAYSILAKNGVPRFAHSSHSMHMLFLNYDPWAQEWSTPTPFLSLITMQENTLKSHKVVSCPALKFLVVQICYRQL